MPHHTFDNISPSLREENSLLARKLRAQKNDAIDLKFGYEHYTTPVDRVGWLINIHPVSTGLA